MNEDIFKSISSELRLKADQSPLVIKRSNSDKKWAYSICGTPIQRNVGVIMGINWGGGSDKSGEEYKPQEKMPTKEEFLKELKSGSYKFLERTNKYLTEYGKVNIWEGEFNYTNLCFFRSPTAKDITLRDYELSIPIFKALIAEINPPQILCLGTTSYKYLKSEFDEISVVRGIEGSKHRAYRGRLWGIPFHCLPHPNAQISTNDRDELWKNVFSDFR